jgi:Holliday junction resolvase RusA-like endonuclease
MATFEFTVEGPPLSHQTKNKAGLQEWRNTVRAAAARSWSQTDPLTGELRMTVTYYHEGPAIRMDNDNMVKPIQDALNGLVYLDDRQITDTVVRKTDINGAFIVRGASLILLQAFTSGKEFVHITIDSAPSHSNLLT